MRLSPQAHGRKSGLAIVVVLVLAGLLGVVMLATARRSVMLRKEVDLIEKQQLKRIKDAQGRSNIVRPAG